MAKEIKNNQEDTKKSTIDVTDKVNDAINKLDRIILDISRRIEKLSERQRSYNQLLLMKAESKVEDEKEISNISTQDSNVESIEKETVEIQEITPDKVVDNKKVQEVESMPSKPEETKVLVEKEEEKQQKMVDSKEKDLEIKQDSIKSTPKKEPKIKEEKILETKTKTVTRVIRTASGEKPKYTMSYTPGQNQTRGRVGRHQLVGTGRPEDAPKTRRNDNSQRPARGGVNNFRKPNNNEALNTFITAPVGNSQPSFNKKKTNTDFEEKKPYSKKSLIKRGYIYDNYITDYERENYKVRPNKRRGDKPQPKILIEHAIINTEIVPIKVLSDKIGVPAVEIVKKLMDMGQMKSINSEIEFETAELIALEYNIELEYKPEVTSEDLLAEYVQKDRDDQELEKRHPVVTIMGHVDHGKTSLLDYIRKTKVASGEAGGITQHIGAYTIKVKGESITFLDTPGHEAFTTMRRRGAMVTDIAIIVIAADDGIMPQTEEAIKHAKEAGVTIIVAANKIDKQTANIEKIKQQMTSYELLPEEWGGDVMLKPVSAHTGAGVDDLLDAILLQAEMLELKAPSKGFAEGSIIEAKLDKNVGPQATVLISSGTLNVGDFMVAGVSTGRVRALINHEGKNVKTAGPSDAVSILGFSDVPVAGDVFNVLADERLCKKIASEREAKDRLTMNDQGTYKPRSLDEMFSNLSKDDDKELSVIVKCDVQGSVEAVKQSLQKLSEEKSPENVSIKILYGQVGAISESDITAADNANAILLAFNVRPDAKAKALANQLSVEIRQYRVIYKMLEDIELALKGLLDPTFKEEVLGSAEVRDLIRVPNVGTIAGSYVLDGKIVRNKQVRLIRDNIVIYEGAISSLKRHKDDVKEVLKGFECGIGISNYNDLKVGDVIEVFDLVEEKQ